MPLIYKICPRALWREAEAAGQFTGAPIDRQDGFIHFSTAAQVAETAARHFAGQDDLLLVAVEAEALGDGLRYEPSRGATCSRTSTVRCRSRPWSRWTKCRWTATGGTHFRPGSCRHDRRRLPARPAAPPSP